ncbi:MAG: ribose-5-phosphate isomerase RpiA [Trueperaceae bacterium]|nr:ribose-5-phosphate isomerase RpiA [Trueperaceae bacterium]
MSELEGFKAEAAGAALEHVRSGTIVGLGTGSTAAYVIAELGRRLREGTLLDVRAVPTSLATQRAAAAAGIPLVDLPSDGVDVAIDGMDEVTDALDAIKGLGGALTREKIVAAAARWFVLVGDHTKRVEALGTRSPVPVEVLGFGLRRTMARLADLGAAPELRLHAGTAYVSDNGHQIVDCTLAAGFDARAFASAAREIPGVVEHGLFLAMAHFAYVSGPDGVDRIERVRTADATVTS